MGMSEQCNHMLEVYMRRTWLLPAFGITTSALTAHFLKCMNLGSLLLFLCFKNGILNNKIWYLCPHPLESGPTEQLVSTVKSHSVCHLPLSWSRDLAQGFPFPLCCKIQSDSSLTSEIKARSWFQAFELIFWACYIYVWLVPHPKESQPLCIWQFGSRTKLDCCILSFW